MFGIDNVGVINQRNAPAIWESNVAEFPNNNIKGRLLLATDTITLYVDLINGDGGMTNRAIIASGLIGYGNGTVINNTGLGNYSVDLGGELQTNTNISLNDRTLTFEGANNTITISGNGVMTSTGIDSGIHSGQFLPISAVSLQTVIPTITLYFHNTSGGQIYKINAQEI
jgi:hypothetical protein